MSILELRRIRAPRDQGVGEFLRLHGTHRFLVDRRFACFPEALIHTVDALDRALSEGGVIYAASVRGCAAEGLIVFKKRGFDTEHFGYPVASVECFDVIPGSSREKAAADQLLTAFLGWAVMERIRFVSVKTYPASVAVTAALEAEGFYLVETIHQLTKQLPDESIAAEADERLRSAAPADCGTAFAISDRAPWESRFFSDPRINREAALALYRKWLAAGFDGRKLCTLIEHHGKVSGFVLWSTETLTLGGRRVTVADWELSAVDPALHGQGIGRALYRGALRAIQESGAEFVRQGVSSHNAAALNLCAKLGFEFNYCQIVHHKFFE